MGKVTLNFLLKYIGGIGTSISQFLNTLLFGSPDMSFSARAYMNARIRGGIWAFIEKIINILFFFETDHCKRSFQLDIVNAKKILEASEKYNL